MVNIAVKFVIDKSQKGGSRPETLETNWGD